MGPIMVTISVVVFFWAVVGLIRPDWARLRNRVSTVGVWALSVFLLIIGGALMPDDEASSVARTPATDRSQTSSAQASPPPPQLLGVGDGTHLVGQDIQAGTYRSEGTSFCYWVRLSGFGGELGDIIANGTDGPEIVTVAASDAGFETQGCGRWMPVESTAPDAPATTVSDGTHAVGMHVAPGTYRSQDGTGLCYWARMSNFGHAGVDGIIANGTNPGIVTVVASDAGFSTQGCGEWTRIAN